MNPSKFLRVFGMAVVGTAAAFLAWQLLIPPIVGLADQGDFARMIGRFGYGPEDKSPANQYSFVVRKYIPDPGFRIRQSEQVSSEYLFVGSALLLNKLLSRDGRFDITLMGLVHMLVFLAVFARLLAVTSKLRAAPVLWIAALMVLTDVGYAAYWNSFYAEPASCIFFLLLLTESLAICQAVRVTHWQVARWCLWAALLVLAKAQNAPLGLLLALFPLRFGPRTVAAPGSAVILLATAVNFVTNPVPSQWANTYNQLFLGILPESDTRVADLKEFGLGPEFARYSGTGAWSPGTAFPEMVTSGKIGRQVTPASIARFYLFHPGRVWRRATSVLPIAFSLRPEWCGNFERSAGRKAGARSTAFSLWSGFRERYLAKAGAALFAAMLICLALLTPAWIRFRAERRRIEFLGLLSAGCLAAFVVAICGEAWDTVKHLFLFNLMLDTWLTAVAFAVWSTVPRWVMRRPRARRAEAGAF